MQYKQASFVRPDESPVAFSLDLAAKDLALILQLAAQVGARLPQAELNRSMLLEAASDGRGGADLSTVASHLRATAGEDGPIPVGERP